MDNLLKVLVKVGNKSSLQFSHSKLYRAILATDLMVLANKNEDIHLVIIESIDKDEDETVKQFIDYFVNKDSNNRVIFYVPDTSDEITSGLADELDYNIYLDIKDVYSYINKTYGVNVSIFLADKKVVTSIDESIMGLGIETVGEGSRDTEQQEFMEDVAASVEEASQTTESKVQPVSSTQASGESQAQAGTADSSMAGIFGTFDSTQNAAESKPVASETPRAESDHTARSIESLEVVEVDTSAMSDDARDTIERLQMNLRDAKYDYGELLKDMREANTRIDELESLAQAIKSEKQAIEDRYNELVIDANVIEDPISLSEYQGVQQRLESAKRKITELDSKIDVLQDEIKSTGEQLEDKEDKYNQTKLALESLQQSVDSGEINKELRDEYEDKIGKLNDSLEQYERDNEQLTEKVKTLSNDNIEYEADMDKLTKQVSTEYRTRKETTRIMQRAFEQINSLKADLDNYSQTVESLKSEKDELLKQIEDNESEYSSDCANKDILIKQLEKKVADFDKRITLSASYSDAEQGKLADKVAELESLLSQSEANYEMLLNQSREDQGASSRATEALENDNRTLKQQIVELKKEVMARKNETAMNESKVSRLNGDVARLQKQLKEAEIQIQISGSSSSSGSGSGSGGLTEVSVPTIMYSGRAQIISVFGSGSHGTTTVAMTLAQRLGAAARVLFMDFDLVSPKADAWIVHSPKCAPIEGLDVKKIFHTSLGIFYVYGMNVIKDNLDKVILQVPQHVTRGGYIQYFTGAYYRVSRQSIFSADYTALFNLLGNMYDYIVVDLGRLGSSEISDSLIKIISDISYNTVAVSTADPFDTRSFKTRFSVANLDQSKIAWLLNMCNSGADGGIQIHKITASVVGAFRSGYVLEDPGIRGKTEILTTNRINNNRFEAFISQALFG